MIERSLADDGAFERQNGAYTVTTATFEAKVLATEDGYRLTCDLPTLDAAVAGETVAEVLEDGWFETLERRLDGIESPLAADDVSLSATRGAESVLVEVRFDSDDPAGDARAAVNFVENTWFQGLVPGYEYVDRVQAEREAARDRGASPS